MCHHCARRHNILTSRRHTCQNRDGLGRLLRKVSLSQAEESAIVLWKPSRADRADRRTLRTLRSGQLLRTRASLLLVIGLLFLAGACGFNVQTNKPYTPAEGVNVDVGDPAMPNKVVHVRNLLIISHAPGEGIVSGSIVTADRDSLTGVSGIPIKPDGSQGVPFTGTIPSTVALANGLQVVLTNQPPILVKSPDIMPGLDAIVTLQFENAGEVTLRAPIVDGNEPQFVSLKPSASPSV
jgi:hypothetical protein